jgi:hypothetical protein
VQSTGDAGDEDNGGPKKTGMMMKRGRGKQRMRKVEVHVRIEQAKKTKNWFKYETESEWKRVQINCI